MFFCFFVSSVGFPDTFPPFLSDCCCCCCLLLLLLALWKMPALMPNKRL